MATGSRHLLDSIRHGDKVTIMRYAGRGREGPEYRPATGTAVMRGDYGWVLNMGGRYGTPATADESNIVKVTRKRKPPGTFSMMNAGRLSRRKMKKYYKKAGATGYLVGGRPSTQQLYYYGKVRKFRTRKTNPKYWTMSRIREWHQGHFFDPDTIKFFSSKIYPTVYEGKGGIFFVTSELPPHGPRIFSVRQFHQQSGGITTAIGGHALRTLEEARYSARARAQGPQYRSNAGRFSVRKTKKYLKKIGVRSCGAKFRARTLPAKRYGRPNPQSRIYRVHVPPSSIDPKGYDMTISAASARSARNEARRWCAQTFREQTGRPMSRYRLPSGTRVQEVFSRAAAANPSRRRTPYTFREHIPHKRIVGDGWEATSDGGVGFTRVFTPAQKRQIKDVAYEYFRGYRPTRNRRRRNVTTYHRSRAQESGAFYRDQYGWHRRQRLIGAAPARTARSAGAQLGLLNEIAMSQMGKSYRSLGPTQRETVKSLAGRAANRRRRSNRRSYRSRRTVYR